MVNAAYHDKPLMFIRAVSDNVFDMINAVYYDNTLMFINAAFREKLVFHHRPVLAT